jgi:hypothetical protein
MDYALEGRHLNIVEFDKQFTVTLYSHTVKGGGSASQKLKPEDFEVVMSLGRGAFGKVFLVRERINQF